ncbi:MAG: hypothetical protein QM602_08115 [Microbacterium sp.]
MRLIVAGMKDGRSALLQEIPIAHPGTAMSTVQVLNLDTTQPGMRAAGVGEYRDYGIPVGGVHWLHARFAPNERRPAHYTNTLDCHTIVEGWIELVLDDGAHRLEPGDGAICRGVDHGWRVGPEGCIVSMMLFGIPGPVSAG